MAIEYTTRRVASNVAGIGRGGIPSTIRTFPLVPRFLVFLKLICIHTLFPSDNKEIVLTISLCTQGTFSAVRWFVKPTRMRHGASMRLYHNAPSSHR